MKILGIETSCDETAAAVVENGEKVLSSILATSSELHAKTGGVIPEQAARKQLSSIIPVIKSSLIETAEKENYTDYVQYLKREIDAIAVTYGPGLIGSLLVGVETAKTLSLAFDKPLIPVNHLVAHIYANWLDNDKKPEFPLIALMVSGGHTDLIYMKDHAQIEWIGGTRDDAAGEAFDKTARLLGIEYPGGPRLAEIADNYIKENLNKNLDMFPRPMLDKDNYEWSFSGLKTSVLNKVQEIYSQNKEIKLSDYEKISENLEVKKQIPSLAAEIQEAIVDSLTAKTVNAAKEYKPKTVIVGGGVSANLRLRHKMKKEIDNLNIEFQAPQSKYSTDNGAIIASCAYFNYTPISYKKLNADPQLTIIGE